MATEAAPAPVEPVPVPGKDSHAQPPTVMTPPNSEEGYKQETDLSSLDLNEDEEEEEIVPDHYWDGGKIPVFKPSMEQFRSFKDYITKIDKYGMKSGIVKVVPPKEWRESLVALDEAVKSIKVKNPITQEISGKSGKYTQANIEKQRSYNLPQWKALTEESQHQPPAKRGERRRTVEKAPKSRPAATAPVAAMPVEGAPRRRGRPPKRRKATPQQEPTPSVEGENASDAEHEAKPPPTPTSPDMATVTAADVSAIAPITDGATATHDGPDQKKSRKTKPASGASRPRGRQAKSVSERRKYNQQEVAEEIDEEAFKGFDYRFHGNDEFTQERCQELEALYWKTLTYAAPMYGADMPGSLFDESMTTWNVAKLENLLDVLGTKVPGVNTAYLYLGMWKATFAWHLEDVDLYSINYIHFGAPKQWYSISQEDARRFENAMRSLWPNDSKNCSQFLRHKTYLVSPTMLQEQFNLKVNKLVHYEGEFVITYPYGYHSGYNLGYNCAESVNFATEEWLEYGKIAKKCDCEADSVWVDAHYIERKLKGEPTPEYYEETDDDEHDEDMAVGDLPTPPSSVAGKSKAGRKRKRDAPKTPVKQRKKVKVRVKQPGFEPCVLCPNNMPFEKLLPTDNGRHAHAICALYTPETYIWPEKEVEGEDPQKIFGIDAIGKERLGLRCYFCNSKKGACFQCSAKKCTRAYHATCAAAAGVRVDCGRTPFFVEGGDEYWIEENDFRCRFHRPKRPKQAGGESLEKDPLIKSQIPRVKPRTVIQAQYFQSDIFAGVVIENRQEEQTLIVDILPEGGDRVEIEYKWVLVQDPDDSQLPKPSINCIGPLPDHFSKSTTQNRNDEYRLPMPDDRFDEQGALKWGEFNAIEPEDAFKLRQHPKVKIDLDRLNNLWHYVGESSTELRPHFTEDIKLRRNNPASNFLDTVKPAQHSALQQHRRSSNTGNLSSPKHSLQPSAKSPLGNRAFQYQPSIPAGAQLALNGTNQGHTASAQSVFVNSFQMSRVPEWLQQTQQSGPPYPVVGHPFQALSAQRRDSKDHNAPLGVMDSSRDVANRSSIVDMRTSRPPLGSSSSVAVPTTNTTTHTLPGVDQQYLEHVKKYPYLRNALLRRPRKYQSPYSRIEASYAFDHQSHPQGVGRILSDNAKCVSTDQA